jgi:16S rRNA (cytosine967-C5)-methyltransferase
MRQPLHYLKRESPSVLNTSYFAPRAPAPDPEDERSPVLSKPLWQLLNLTAKSVHEVMLGRSATAVLLGLDVSFKPGVQSLLFLSLRQWGLAKAVRAHLVAKKPSSQIDHLLCVCLALLCDESDLPYEPHTLVNQAVQAAKANVNTAGQSAMLNAVLRRFLRERQDILQAVSGQAEAQYKHPLWWIKLLQKDHPDDWAHILEVAQTPAVMTLRVNEAQQTRDAYAVELASEGLHAKPMGDSALVLDQPVGVQRLPGFEAGGVSVQDANAQLAAPLLLGAFDEERLATLLASQKIGSQESSQEAPTSPTSPTSQTPLPLFSILDACAAPGGKTAHLLELLSPKNKGRPLALRASKEWQIEVHAVELEPKRAQKVVESLDRARLKARVWVGDAAKSAEWSLLSGPASHAPPLMYQAILLDAPCSASGIVRRHPDIRWLRRADDIPRLFEVQSRLLKHLWAQLAPAGVLLYCTCSVFKDEGERQINSFLKHNSDASKLPSPGHLIPQKTANDATLLDNQASDQDGFYYALLQKSPSP